MTLRHLACRVWLHPGDPDPDNVRPGVAVVAGDGGSVIVDAGQSPAHAREIQAALRAADLPAARWLVYTHHYWDHVWGACAWPDVEIVGHAAGVEPLRAEAGVGVRHVRGRHAPDSSVVLVPDSGVLLLRDC
ncbi:MBL fold metallo-hydrolase [Micromonospora sp. IBHARD004]|uniref:MBL fold metallo-hydrolase n=1 Tax=Micromonospora sp. IBHARD004 TaxID=3457764 RepID=UPI004059326C